jgi:hypothetical protein
MYLLWYMPCVVYASNHQNVVKYADICSTLYSIQMPEKYDDKAYALATGE